jgi:hypothetical protein
MSRDDSLVELTGRYFTSRGPATIQDFSKWSGLSVADCRKGLEAVKSNLEHDTHNNQEYWYPRNSKSISKNQPNVRLLSIYDEYISSYKDHSIIGSVDIGEKLKALGNDLTSIILIDGQIAGTWKREMGKDTVSICLSLLNDRDDVQRSAIHDESLSYGKFFGKMVQLLYN